MLEIEDQLRRHADWVETRMRPIVLPSAPAPSDEADAEPEVPEVATTRRPGRRLWTALAAAAVIALVVASVAAVRSRSDQTTPPAPVKPTAPSALVGTGPDSIVLPAATPTGFVAGTVTTNTPDDGRNSNLDATGPPVTQLFGEGDQPRLELRIEPTRLTDGVGGGTRVTVRGHAAVLYSPGQPIEIDRVGGSSFEFAPADGADARYSWFEHGALITAAFAHLTAAQALDLVDHMTWTSTAASGGFALAQGSGLVSLAGPNVLVPTGHGLGTEVDYLVAPANTTAVTLFTCPGGAGACPYVGYDYASAWLTGSRSSDGSATFWTDGRPPDGTFHGATGSSGIFVRVWPDGAAARVDFGIGATVDLDLARQLTDHLVVTDRSGLARLRQEISAEVADLPVVAAADLADGRVEVHGTGDLVATCFAPAGGPLVCGSGEVIDPKLPPTGGVQTSALVDGHWWVAIGSTNPGPIAFASGDSVDFDHPAGPPLAGATAPATVGSTTYQLGLVEVPDGVTGIMVTQSTGGGIGGGSVERPTS